MYERKKIILKEFNEISKNLKIEIPFNKDYGLIFNQSNTNIYAKCQDLLDKCVSQKMLEFPFKNKNSGLMYDYYDFIFTSYYAKILINVVYLKKTSNKWKKIKNHFIYVCFDEISNKININKKTTESINELFNKKILNNFFNPGIMILQLDGLSICNLDGITLVRNNNNINIITLVPDKKIKILSNDFSWLADCPCTLSSNIDDSVAFIRIFDYNAFNFDFELEKDNTRFIILLAIWSDIDLFEKIIGIFNTEKKRFNKFFSLIMKHATNNDKCLYQYEKLIITKKIFNETILPLSEDNQDDIKNMKPGIELFQKI